MASKYDGLARIIMQNVGGTENVKALTHCVTRLRFKLKDEKKANTDVLKETEGIVTVIQNSEQYMVVIGNHVPDVYDAVVKRGHLENITEDNSLQNEEKSKEKQKPLDVFVGIVTSVFTPILGVLSACGILKGLLAMFVAFGVLSTTSGTYNFLYSLSDSLFYFLPIILGYTAAKRFGISELEGLVIGATMVYPNLLSGGQLDISNIFGIPVTMPAAGDYTSSVIPIICAVAFAAWFEKRYKRFIPDTIKLFTIPFITCLVTVCMTFWIIGPVASTISDLLGAAFTAVYKFSPILMGFVVGGLWQVLVMFGLHWAITPLMINNVQTLGFDTIMIGMFGASFAQTGAVIAIYLRSRNKNTKSLCIPAIVSGLAGVTEPAIYGITLPKKKPFIITCIISAITGAIIAASGAKYYIVPGMGVFGYTAFMNTQTQDITGMIWAIGASILALVGGFAAVYLTYREKEEKKTTPQLYSNDFTEIVSPMNGKVIALEEVEDEVFKGGSLGQGVALIPTEGELYAPIDGTIAMVFPTGHAIGIKTIDGLEILMHVGMNTVELNGKGFNAKVKPGDHIVHGNLLLEFDIEAIQEAGYSVVTPIVITNSNSYHEVLPDITGESIHVGDKLITVR